MSFEFRVIWMVIWWNMGQFNKWAAGVTNGDGKFCNKFGNIYAIEF